MIDDGNRSLGATATSDLNVLIDVTAKNNRQAGVIIYDVARPEHHSDRNERRTC